MRKFIRTAIATFAAVAFAGVAWGASAPGATTGAVTGTSAVKVPVKPIVTGAANINTGIVKDASNGLVWLKNAGCLASMTFAQAAMSAHNLKSGDCGINDGSMAGQWRLPTRDQLRERYMNKQGFTNVQGGFYWSDSAVPYSGHKVYIVNMGSGAETHGDKTGNYYVWPVRW
jgi:hypothetical protein